MSRLKENLSSLQQKAQERTVKTQTIEYDLETLVKKIDKGTIKLNPEYQRRHRWSEEFSSRLIESLILNIPIPLVYISQDIDVDEEVDDEIARYSVIDGQQRLTAIYNFFKGKYGLNGLNVLGDLNGSYYKDIPPFLTRRLEERTIRCLRIDSTLDSQVKYDIFERLNSGAVKLEAQELRNAICRGPFKDLIKELAKNEKFKKMANIEEDGKRKKKMEDEELVLRFFALSYNDGYLMYKGGFKNFLTQKMEEFNQLQTKEIYKMKSFFLETFEFIHKNLGESAFAKYKTEGGSLKRMSKFNAAVYDSIAVAIYNHDKSKKVEKENFLKLFRDPEYFSSIEGSVNDVSKVQIRIKKGIEASK